MCQGLVFCPCIVYYVNIFTTPVSDTDLEHSKDNIPGKKLVGSSHQMCHSHSDIQLTLQQSSGNMITICSYLTWHTLWRGFDTSSGWHRRFCRLDIAHLHGMILSMPCSVSNNINVSTYTSTATARMRIPFWGGACLVLTQDFATATDPVA